MTPHRTSPPLRRAAALCLLLALAGCGTPPPGSPVMPPEPPRETVVSTIVPPDPTPLPTPALPAGIELLLDGQSVTLADLSEQPLDQEAPTVIVRAARSTPFRDVSRTLEKLHNLGYRVAFAARD